MPSARPRLGYLGTYLRPGESSPYIKGFIARIMNRPDQISTVIDVGGGAQLRDLRILKELGIQLGVGVDIQKAADTEARRLGIHYIRADIDRDGLPIADSVADAVLMNNVIEHMYCPGMVLKECRRVLRPGGLLYVLTPNQARLINRFRLLLGRSVYYPMDYWLGDSDEHITRDDRRVYAGHIREYTLSEVLKMLKYAGFEVQGTQMLAAPSTSSREHLSSSRFLVRSYNVLERMLPSSAYMISVAAIRPSHE